MPIDPKVRTGISTVRLPTTTTPTPAPRTVAPQPQPQTTVPSGYRANSTFEGAPRPSIRRDGVPDDSVGRRRQGGVADDGVGRKTVGGAADDGVGRKTVGGAADDGVGRKTVGGAADDGVGRKTVGGAADDGVGRKTTTGAADDGVGRKKTTGAADDGVGRKKTTGAADDGVGRKKTTGAADDGVGRMAMMGAADDGVGRKTTNGAADEGVGAMAYEAVLDTLVGRNDTKDSLALRDAIFQRLETPSFLKGSATVPAQVAAFAKTLGLSKSQSAQVDSVLRGSSKEVAGLFGALLEKNREVLTTADSKGQTTLANLARIATQPLHPNASSDTAKGDVLASVLRNLVNPNRIDQGDAPTCTVTSMQFELVTDDPSEYTRLMADLTGPQGRAMMRGGGELLLEAGETGARDNRSVADTIFQNAAMEFGNGKDAQFDPYAGKSVNQKTGAEQRGLKPAQQTQVLRQLFGVNYESKNFLTEAEGAKALEKLRTVDTLDRQNRPIILQLDQGDFNHAVTFERVKDERVYFRDPYGVLRSMPEDHFAKFVMAVNAPRDMNIV